MAESSSLYVDVHTGKLIYESGAVLNKDDRPVLFLEQLKTFQFNLMEYDSTTKQYVQYTKLTASYTFYFALANYWYGESVAALNSGVSGSVSTIDVKTLTVTPKQAGGWLELVNSSGQSEVVQYDSWTEAAGVYTFTLTGAPVLLTYTYLTDDVVNYIVQPLVLAENADIDSTNKNTGVFLVTLDGSDELLEAELAGQASVTGLIFEFGAIDVSNRPFLVVQGDTFQAKNRIWKVPQ